MPPRQTIFNRSQINVTVGGQSDFDRVTLNCSAPSSLNAGYSNCPSLTRDKDNCSLFFPLQMIRGCSYTCSFWTSKFNYTSVPSAPWNVTICKSIEQLSERMIMISNASV